MNNQISETNIHRNEQRLLASGENYESFFDTSGGLLVDPQIFRQEEIFTPIFIRSQHTDDTKDLFEQIRTRWKRTHGLLLFSFRSRISLRHRSICMHMWSCSCNA